MRASPIADYLRRRHASRTQQPIRSLSSAIKANSASSGSAYARGLRAETVVHVGHQRRPRKLRSKLATTIGTIGGSGSTNAASRKTPALSGSGKRSVTLHVPSRQIDQVLPSLRHRAAVSRKTLSLCPQAASDFLRPHRHVSRRRKYNQAGRGLRRRTRSDAISDDSKGWLTILRTQQHARDEMCI